MELKGTLSIINYLKEEKFFYQGKFSECVEYAEKIVSIIEKTVNVKRKKISMYLANNYPALQYTLIVSLDDGREKDIHIFVEPVTITLYNNHYVERPHKNLAKVTYIVRFNI